MTARTPSRSSISSATTWAATTSALSLHKWLYAPKGTGLLYVKRDKIEKVWPLMAAEEKQDADIRKFEEIGTHSAAPRLAIGEALLFHQRPRPRAQGGAAALPRAPLDEPAQGRAARALQHLLRRRASPAPSRTSRSKASTRSRSAHYLMSAHKIFTTPIVHDEFNGIRITPNVYTTLNELDRFCEVMRRVATKGLPTS